MIVSYDRLWVGMLTLVTAGSIAFFGHHVYKNSKPCPDPTPVDPVPVIVDGIKLPADFGLDIGELEIVTAETSGTVVRWDIDPGLSIKPYNDKAVVVGGKKNGKFRMLAWSSVDGTATKGVSLYVTVPKTKPKPVDPIPPTPPEPPPTPPSPVPTDPFFQTLSDTWKTESDPNKAIYTIAMAAAFRHGADMAKDTSYKTVKDFQTSFNAELVKQSINKVLTPTRQAIGLELKKVLPNLEVAPMDDKTRSLISTHYQRIATDLEGLR